MLRQSLFRASAVLSVPVRLAFGRIIPGRGAIQITECAGGLCGHIVWVKDTAHKSECGSQIIGDAKRTSTGAWDGGWIYDPERKARFSVELKPMGSDKLRVMGYQGSKMFNETFTWTRPTSQLKWCDDGPTPAVAPSTPGDKAKPEEAAKVEPAPDRERENPPGGKDTKSGNPNLGDLAETLKFKKRQVNGKWECTVNAPYVEQSRFCAPTQLVGTTQSASNFCCLRS